MYIFFYAFLIKLEGFMNLSDPKTVGYHPSQKNKMNNNILFRIKVGNKLLFKSIQCIPASSTKEILCGLKKP